MSSFEPHQWLQEKQQGKQRRAIKGDLHGYVFFDTKKQAAETFSPKSMQYIYQVVHQSRKGVKTEGKSTFMYHNAIFYSKQIYLLCGKSAAQSWHFL